MYVDRGVEAPWVFHVEVEFPLSVDIEVEPPWPFHVKNEAPWSIFDAKLGVCVTC